MRQFLEIPEHGVRANYPLTTEIMNHPKSPRNGVDEMNKLIKDAVNQMIEWGGIAALNRRFSSGQHLPVDLTRCQLPWMKEPVIVNLERVSTIPKPVKEKGPALAGTDFSHLKNPCEEIDIRDIRLQGPPIIDLDMAADFKATEEQREQIERIMAEKNKLLYEDMLNVSIFGTSISRCLRGPKTEVNRNMMDRDLCAPGMLHHNSRKQQKEQRQRATEHLRKREESRTLHAALAFDNTAGFTGMAHVDTLRGQL